MIYDSIREEFEIEVLVERVVQFEHSMHSFPDIQPTLQPPFSQHSVSDWNLTPKVLMNYLWNWWFALLSFQNLIQRCSKHFCSYFKQKNVHFFLIEKESKKGNLIDNDDEIMHTKSVEYRRLPVVTNKSQHYIFF